VLRPICHTATCRRDGSGWVIQVASLGASARAERLSQVEAVARRLVASRLHDKTSSCRVMVELQVHHGLDELLSAAAATRSEVDRVSVEAVTLRRCLARLLAEEGFDGHDVAALLGISYGRALQLMGDGVHHAKSTTAATRQSDHDTSWSASRAKVERLRTGRGGVKPHQNYRHEAYFYRGNADFVAGIRSFVEEGVRLGQPVMVAVVPERLELLRATVENPDPVHWVDMAELGANPARLIPAWRQFIDEHDGAHQPVRGVGEPVWSGRRPVEIAECQLHEALLNLAIEPDTPVWLRCPYDLDALDTGVLEESSRSHPALIEAGDYRGSLTYGGADHAGSVFGRELPEPTGPVEELRFDDGTLWSVRPAVLARAASSRLPPDRGRDLALAVTEAATNSVQHGGGRGDLRVWEQDGALVCEVRDAGRIDDPLVGRHLPSVEKEGGRGLWLANQLSDLVQVRSTKSGSTVRVLNWL